MLTKINLQVTYFKQRRVAEFEKEQLLQKQQAASLASR
jgi:hypothetical protein